MIRPIIDNIISKGYRLEETTEDGWIILTHDTLTPVLVQDNEKFITIMSKYKINTRVQTEERRLQKIVNELNSESIIAKYWIKLNPEIGLDSIIITATWLNFYNEYLFDTFFKTWEFENRDQVFDAEGIEDFLLLTRKSQIAA